MLTMNKMRKILTQAVPRSFLGTMDLFKSLPTEALQAIEGRMVEKKYPKNSSIFLEGDQADSVWFVKEGHVKAVVNTPNGRCQALCMVGPRNMFGSCCAMGGGTYYCHAMAETDVTVVSIPLPEFLSLMGRYPQVSSALVQQISKRLRQSKDSQAFEQESVERRILRVLSDMVEEFGNTIPLTRREIAEMAGTTVETSIRTFSKLEAEGLVSTVRGKITVRDLSSLKSRL